MNKCERCNNVVDYPLYESAWEDETEVCEECFEDTVSETMDYMFDMYYACINGCCACCGCSCR